MYCTWALYCWTTNADEQTLRHADERFTEQHFLPVLSSSLSPGAVRRRLLSATGLPAFFLVGDDKLSRSWLKQRQAQLMRLNAAGLVVNVQSNAALEGLRQIAKGLTLSPVSADDLAQRLNIQHYPVLITSDGIEQ
jgi:integrating conjugative element protein (TIGR03765 family)